MKSQNQYPFSYGTLKCCDAQIHLSHLKRLVLELYFCIYFNKIGYRIVYIGHLRNVSQNKKIIIGLSGLNVHIPY